MTELEKLKKENEILKSRLNTIANIDRESKYKQALKEIKKLAEKEHRTQLEQKGCMNCDDGFKKIVDIISEVNNVRFKNSM